MIRVLSLILWCASALPLYALDLDLPVNARQTVERVSALDTYQAPIGAFSDGAVPHLEVEGRVDRRVWRVDGQAMTSLQLLDPLQAQIEAAGFETVFDCYAKDCGGFDFRFAIEAMPTPNMFVDIRDYRFLTALSGPAGRPDEVITLLVSKSGSSGYIQVIQVVARNAMQRTTTTTGSPVAENQNDLPTQLTNFGHVVLPDLNFETGSSRLSDGDYPSLVALAKFMADNSSLNIALVGHTDSQGDLSANVSLSKRRAESVMERLISEFDVPATRMRAEGMGYLAPIASNVTQDGRDLNRRVEAIIVSTD